MAPVIKGLVIWESNNPVVCDGYAKYEAAEFIDQPSCKISFIMKKTNLKWQKFVMCYPCASPYILFYMKSWSSYLAVLELRKYHRIRPTQIQND